MMRFLTFVWSSCCDAISEVFDEVHTLNVNDFDEALNGNIELGHNIATRDRSFTVPGRETGRRGTAAGGQNLPLRSLTARRQPAPKFPIVAVLTHRLDEQTLTTLNMAMASAPLIPTLLPCLPTPPTSTAIPLYYRRLSSHLPPLIVNPYHPFLARLEAS